VAINVLVRDIPDDVHTWLRVEAAVQRVSLAQLIRDILATHVQAAKEAGS